MTLPGVPTAAKASPPRITNPWLPQEVQPGEAQSLQTLTEF
jgi:hypothetical protein